MRVASCIRAFAAGILVIAANATARGADAPPPGGVPGTLLYGVEAPLGDTRALFPVQVRVAESGAVPDAYRGCYVSAVARNNSAAGRMTASVTTLTCVRKEGTTRTEVRGYLVGEDDYLGLRGSVQKGALKVKPGQKVTVVLQE